MEYRIAIEEYKTQKIIHTYITGAVSGDDRDKVGAETFHKMRDNNITKVIWDVREADLHYSLISAHLTVENSRAADDSSVTGIRKNDYFAVIYSRDKELLEHANTVAHNRGIYNLQYFQNIEEGIEWLTSRD